MACNHSGSCELFPLMAMEPALNLWKKHFCDGAFNGCARYRRSLNSKPVPLTLLPNGMQLAQRSREEINSAALFNAIEEGRVHIIKSMIKTGIAKMAAQTSHGLIPLMAAVRVNNVEIVTLMLEHGSNPWRKDAEGSTALDMAIANGYEACIDIILEKMRTTTPQDYAQLSETTIVNDIDINGSNVVSIFKNINP